MARRDVQGQNLGRSASRIGVHDRVSVCLVSPGLVEPAFLGRSEKYGVRSPWVGSFAEWIDYLLVGR